MKSMSRVAFKTGTSAHAKDMLTIGYTPKYTVAVWYGNFSGASSKKYQGVDATGLKIASPTLFKIFNILGKQPWFSKPKGIITKNICQDAIQLGTCQQKVKDEVIENIEIKEQCHSMRAEVLSYLQKQGSIASIEELKNHTCYQEWKSYKPLITSPVHEKTYSYNALLPQEFKKTKLECYSFEQNSTIYWLIDKQEPVQGISGQSIYKYLSPTVHNISCIDEGAKVSKVSIFNKEL
jgi:penicillin-binding protein 1C